MRFKIFIIILLIWVNISAKEILTLYGNGTQGGLLAGIVDKNVKEVFIDDHNIEIFNNKIIIGFDRDEDLNHTIRIILNDNETITKDFAINKRNYKIQRIDNIPEKYVKQPENKELIKRIINESNNLKAIREYIYNPVEFYGNKIVRPVEGGKVTGVFGSQRILNGKPKRPHNGLDIAAPIGTDVKAMTAGKVALIGDYYYNGKFVLLDHGSGLSSIYIHLSKITVHIGESIRTGDKIGEIGSTGRATGAHLHWGVNWFKKK